MNTIKDAISPLLAERGKQSEIAEATGISQPAISLWLAGQRGMPIDKQIAIAEALGCVVTIKVKSPRSRRL